jgi:hypothetical protein
MNRHSSPIAIIVNAFSRAESLEKCLDSILESVGEAKIPLILIHQTGHLDVENVILHYSPFISTVRTVTSVNRTALENINHNRLLGYEVAFNEFRAEWVLAIEEDVLISGDAVRFISHMIERYENYRFFRGINLGSREPFDLNLISTYSRLRYGMHGQASVIGKRTWNYINRRNIKARFSTHGFDSLIEVHLKCGFMVTPNLSRSLDTGWDGTHMPSDSNDLYFEEMRASFVGIQATSRSYYCRNILHRWREDLEVYSVYRTPKFLLLSRWNTLKHKVKFYFSSAH